MRDLKTRKLTRKGQWLRLAMSGPTGSGKTWTSLLFAQEMASAPSKVLLVDTEVAGPEDPEAGTIGAADLFADDFPGIEHFQWEPPFNPIELADALKRWAGQFEVIVIDSLTHFWVGEGGTMDIKDTAEREQFRGNGAAAWSVATPAQDALVDSIQRARCHLIACMRAKEKLDLSGRTPVNLGLQAIQRPGLEHEFTIGLLMDRDHRITVTKTRMDALEGREFPGSRDRMSHLALIEEIKGWLGSAEAMAGAAPPDRVEWIRATIQAIGNPTERGKVKEAFRQAFGATDRLTVDTIGPAEVWVRDRLGLQDPAPAAAPEPAVAPKTRKRAPGGSRKGQAGSGKDSGATAQDPVPDAPGGSGPGYDPDVARGVLAGIVLRLVGEFAVRAEDALTDAGLWPIDSIPDDRVEEAGSVLEPIASAAHDAGQVTR